MKKIFPIFLAAATVLAFGACDIIPQPDNEPDGSQYAAAPALKITSKNVVFNPQGGTGYIVADASGNLTAYADRPWITVTVSGNRVDLAVSPNETLQSRYATVTLKSGSEQAEIIAHQFGVKSDLVWEESYRIPFEGTTLSLPYEEPGTVWVEIEGTKWIHADVIEGAVQYTFDRSLYNYERTGSTTVTIGDWVRSVTFVQEPNPDGFNPGDEEPHEFVLQPAWTPVYVEPVDNEQTFSTVGVDVEDPAAAGKFFIQVVPQSEFTAAGGDHQLMLNRNAAAWLSASPVLYRATSRLEIDKLGNGNYLLYAIGVGPDGALSYDYAVTTFKVTVVLSPYEKFLGTWSVMRGAYEDTWTVAEKVPGVSYTVTGLEGGSAAFMGEYELDGVFNADDNTFSLRTKANLGEYTFTNSGTEHTVQMRFNGLIEYNGSSDVSVGGDYVACVAALTGDGRMTVTAGPSLRLQGADGEYPLTGMRFNGIEGNSAWSFDNSTPYRFPFTATQLTQGGGSGGGNDPGDDPGSSGYEKWLGTWTVAGVDLTVSQKVSGQTYTVSGLEGYDFETRYVDGKMEFFYQVIATSGSRELCLFGIDDDGQGYVVDGDPAKDGLLATATLDAAGKSANLVGAEYDAVYGGTSYHERIVTIRLLAYDSAEDGFYYASQNPVEIDLPATMTKASSSSVKAIRTACYDMHKGEFIPLYKTFQSGPAVPYKRR
ncbi:MAG: BACON domain-containing protein [Bacteroidales bacterium]|nr:BACON domain-containing protein [Bacteroidales bacterium]